VNNIFDALGYLKMCSCWDPQNLTITRLCGKMCVQICCIIMRLMVTALHQGSSLGMKHGSITWNRGQKHSLEWLHSNSTWKKKFKAAHSAGKIMATVFWDAGVILEDICPLTQICTVKLLKPSRNISGEFNLTKMLLKLSFSVTMHDYTQV
jgi:hypothetical protein